MVKGSDGDGPRFPAPQRSGAKMHLDYCSIPEHFSIALPKFQPSRSQMVSPCCSPIPAHQHISLWRLLPGLRRRTQFGYLDSARDRISRPCGSAQTPNHAVSSRSKLPHSRLIRFTLTTDLANNLQFAVLAPYVDQNPAQSGALYTTYTDICLCECYMSMRCYCKRD